MDQKVPFYNIVNMLLVGLVFIGFVTLVQFDQVITMLTDYRIIGWIDKYETIITIFFIAMIYEVGLIINRLGSVFTEPILIKLRIIEMNNDYKRFNEKKKEFPALDILSREYALSRTSVTLFAIISLVSVIKASWFVFWISIAVTILFGCSVRKFNKRITKLLS